VIQPDFDLMDGLLPGLTPIIFQQFGEMIREGSLSVETECNILIVCVLNNKPRRIASKCITMTFI